MTKFYTNIQINAVPADPNHAARLQDVVDLVGAHYKLPVMAAEFGDTPSTDFGSFTYDSSAKTLTAAAAGACAVDGVDLDTAGMRILIANSSTASQNGIYTVTTVGNASTALVVTRAEDFNATSKISTGVKVHVVKGTQWADFTFVLVTDSPVLDTSDLEWAADAGKIASVKQERFAIFGNGSATEFTLTHAFDTTDVSVDLIAASTLETVYTDVIRVSATQVKVVFAIAPAAGTNFVVIIRGFK